MARLVRLLVAAILVGLPVVAATPASAQSVGEQIDALPRRDRDRNATGRLRIHESITYDFGTEPHHGHPPRSRRARAPVDDSKHDRRYQIDVERVTADAGASSAVKQSTSGPYLHLRIGDPDRTITGVHTYQLVYTVRGAPLTFADHDELYWDAIGNQWPVPIRQRPRRGRAPARSRASGAIRARPGAHFRAAASATGRTATFAERALGAGSGLTAVVAMPRGTIQPAPEPILEK